MSLNTLKIASDGYLKKTTKVALVIAVAGYLNFGGVPPTPSPVRQGMEVRGGGYNENELRRQLIEDDAEVLLICKAFMYVAD